MGPVPCHGSAQGPSSHSPSKKQRQVCSFDTISLVQLSQELLSHNRLWLLTVSKPASAQRDNYLSSPEVGPQILQLKASWKSFQISQACRSLPSPQGQHSITHILTKKGTGNYPKSHQLQDPIFNLQSHIVHICKPIVLHIFKTLKM